jgi:hypothetical protein
MLAMPQTARFYEDAQDARHIITVIPLVKQGTGAYTSTSANSMTSIPTRAISDHCLLTRGWTLCCYLIWSLISPGSMPIVVTKRQ